ncbi:MAG: hypothetical protein V4850_08685 [Myxococcota bacterium]
MTRSLQPVLASFDKQRLERGALIILSGDRTKARALTFQYNPESVTRTRQGAWEYRKNGQGKEQALSAAEQKLQDSFRGAGFFVKAETIAFKLVFDATEAILSGQDAGKGILPELSQLELVAFGSDARVDRSAAPAGQNRLNPIFPTELLLVLGLRRFPVILTQMTITEKRFDPALVPIRAEIDLAMRVLEPLETTETSVIWQAFEELQRNRGTWRDAAEGGGETSVAGQSIGAMVTAVLKAPIADAGIARPVAEPPAPYGPEST